MKKPFPDELKTPDGFMGWLCGLEEATEKLPDERAQRILGYVRQVKDGLRRQVEADEFTAEKVSLLADLCATWLDQVRYLKQEKEAQDRIN